MTTTTIKGTEYRIEKTGEAFEHPRLAADLIARGFDGCSYLLHGKRGACRLAYRSVRTGQYVIAY